jgi:hypothetical protein
MKNVQEYDGKDKEFERWLEMNPNGYDSTATRPENCTPHSARAIGLMASI